jgi:hypothetical protein
MNKIPFQPIGFFQKATSFLIGFLLSFLTFFLFLKIFSNFWGAIIALLLNLGASLYLIKTFRNAQIIRTMAIGILGAIAVMVLLSLILWTALMALFQGIAN